MSEFLDNCHLCGHEMASNAPACPNCFARSDPAAREAIRQSKHEQWLAKHQRATDRVILAREKHKQSIAAQKPILVTLLLAYVALLIAFAFAGYAALALPSTLLLAVAMLIWRSRIFTRP